tara:strand:- start:3408 stop:4874 length:1467 start_codon:yes stop_codon:yes gene_type:complete
MIILVANLLDNNYSQTQINALYTQAKNQIEDPFEFWVFTSDEECRNEQKNKGYLDEILFDVPKYGEDWIEIDLMQKTKKGDSLLFVTPNCILNNISVIETYKTNSRIRLSDGNLCYNIFHNNKVEQLLKEWEEREDELLYEYDAFHNWNMLSDTALPFLQDSTSEYPEKLEGDVIALPQWYDDFTQEEIDSMYNKETDLYPYLPQKVEMELNETGVLFDDVKEAFNPDFLLKAKLRRIKIVGEEPTLNPDVIDIIHYFIKEWVISVDIESNGDTHDKIWWTNIGNLLKELGNVTFNINTGNPDKRILEHAKALIDVGCRVFWSYTHTNQLDNDIQKAKRLCKQHKFSGFVYDNKVPEEKQPINKKVKVDLPDYKLIELETLETRIQDDIYKERKIKFYPHIKCEGKVNNQFYLSSEGNVFPCKHIALTIRTANDSPEHVTKILYDWDKNNINNFSLEDIFVNDFYKGYFNNLLKLNPGIIHDEQGGIC